MKCLHFKLHGEIRSNVYGRNDQVIISVHIFSGGITCTDHHQIDKLTGYVKVIPESLSFHNLRSSVQSEVTHFFLFGFTVCRNITLPNFKRKWLFMGICNIFILHNLPGLEAMHQKISVQLFTLNITL